MGISKEELYEVLKTLQIVVDYKNSECCGKELTIRLVLAGEFEDEIISEQQITID